MHHLHKLTRQFLLIGSLFLDQIGCMRPHCQMGFEAIFLISWLSGDSETGKFINRKTSIDWTMLWSSYLLPPCSQVRLNCYDNFWIKLLQTVVKSPVYGQSIETWSNRNWIHLSIIICPITPAFFIQPFDDCVTLCNVWEERLVLLWTGFVHYSISQALLIYMYIFLIVVYCRIGRMIY